MSAKRSFSPKLFAFLKDLAANNDREWFAANRERYERDVLEPALEFVEDMGPRLDRISTRLLAIPRASGGSLFRIHRDTRFSKDKTPYKTNIGIHFRHERAKDAHAPGFYLHLEPGRIFAGGGIWHPDGPAVRAIREAIVADPAGWKRATRGKRFTDVFELSGRSLKRAPRGFDPDHPLVGDLRLTDFVGMAKLRQADVCAPGFADDYAEMCARAAPLMAFLCGALRVEF